MFDEIKTKRLILRQWKESDLVPFREMNSDPRVMEHFPALLDQVQSDHLANREKKRIEELGFGLFAVSVVGVSDFIGFVGFKYWDKEHLDTPFTPAYEVGWRLAFKHWGKGYATEAARAALAYGFEELGLEEIVSMTAVSNIRSQMVMERLGMQHDPQDDFLHPALSDGHPLKPHVLYRIKQNQFYP